VRQYRFRAVIRLDAGARKDPARGCSGIRPVAAHACYIVEPACCRDYFPAVIVWDEELPRQPRGQAVVTMALAGSEAEVFFSPGQQFTVWADVIVGRTLRAEGRVGDGVISRRVSPPAARAGGDGIHRRAPEPDRGRRLAAAGAAGRP
jgi:hypothetical protein